MNKFKYRVTRIPSALKVGGQKLAPMKANCVVCNKRVSNYTNHYTVEQIDGTDMACYPYKMVCSKICSEMLILSSLDEGTYWTKKLRGTWTVETPTQLRTIFGMNEK